MKDLVLAKPFGTEKEFYIVKADGDEDKYCLQYYDKKLDITISILPDVNHVDPIDGGSQPDILHGLIAPLQDKSAHSFGVHDKFWSHRELLKELYKELGITFTQTNRIMKDIQKLAGCNWMVRNSTRLGVRYFGYWKWTHPSDDIKNLKTQTLILERGDKRK